MNNVSGTFQCTKCKLVFSGTPHLMGGWHIVCPNNCTNLIKYDNHPEYEVYHKLFKWLNFKEK